MRWRAPGAVVEARGPRGPGRPGRTSPRRITAMASVTPGEHRRRVERSPGPRPERRRSTAVAPASTRGVRPARGPRPQRAPVDQRAELGVGVEPRAHAQGSGPGDQLGDERVGDGLVHVDPLDARRRSGPALANAPMAAWRGRPGRRRRRRRRAAGRCRRARGAPSAPVGRRRPARSHRPVAVEPVCSDEVDARRCGDERAAGAGVALSTSYEHSVGQVGGEELRRAAAAQDGVRSDGLKTTVLPGDQRGRRVPGQATATGSFHGDERGDDAARLVDA